MTPEQGYDLADFQRPGYTIVMGPTEAREEMTQPVSSFELDKMQGEYLWADYVLRRRLGFLPSLWSKIMVVRFRCVIDRDVTDDEWRWLHGPATLEAVEKWIELERKENERTKTT